MRRRFELKKCLEYGYIVEAYNFGFRSMYLVSLL